MLSPERRPVLTRSPCMKIWAHRSLTRETSTSMLVGQLLLGKDIPNLLLTRFSSSWICQQDMVQLVPQLQRPPAVSIGSSHPVSVKHGGGNCRQVPEWKCQHRNPHLRQWRQRQACGCVSRHSTNPQKKNNERQKTKQAPKTPKMSRSN